MIGGIELLVFLGTAGFRRAACPPVLPALLGKPAKPPSVSRQDQPVTPSRHLLLRYFKQYLAQYPQLDRHLCHRAVFRHNRLFLPGVMMLIQE